MAEWMEVKTQSDADVLTEAFGGFHDSCIREAHLETGCWVAPDLSMTCSSFLDHKIRFLVQRQYKDPPAIELLFEMVTRFNLVPAPEHSDSIISEATILVKDGVVFLAVQDGWRPDGANRDDVTWVSAKALRWRESTGLVWSFATDLREICDLAEQPRPPEYWFALEAAR